MSSRDGRQSFFTSFNSHEKQTSLGSMPVSFNSLTDDDIDGYLFNVPAQQKTNRFDSESNIVQKLDKSSSENDGLNFTLKSSHSAEAFDKIKTDSSLKPEKRSFFSGLKGKLSDKFPDTYNSISRKIEEFTSDRNSLTKTELSESNSKQLVTGQDLAVKKHRTNSEFVNSTDTLTENVSGTFDVSNDQALRDKTSTNYISVQPKSTNDPLQDCMDDNDSNQSSLIRKSESNCTNGNKVPSPLLSTDKSIVFVTDAPLIHPEIDAPLTPVVDVQSTPVLDASLTPVILAPLTPVIDATLTPVVDAPLTPVVHAPLTPVIDAPLTSPVIEAPLMPPANDALLTPPVINAPLTSVIDTSFDSFTESPLAPSVTKTLSTSSHISDKLDKKWNNNMLSNRIDETTDFKQSDDVSFKTDKSDKTVFNPPCGSPSATTIANNLYKVRILQACIVLFIYFVIPLPVFVHGVIIGVTVMASTLYLLKLAKPKKKKAVSIVDRGEDVQQFYDLPDYSKITTPDQAEEELYKGWMNECNAYDQDTYHVLDTNSVFIRLEGTSLRLSNPETNISRRASCEDTLTGQKFIRQRHYDLKGGKVFLLPSALIKKRVWSKKYPIVVQIAQSPSSPERLSSFLDDQPTSERSGRSVRSRSKSMVTLYLFARSSPEKEQWFYKFYAASKGVPLRNQQNFIYETMSGKNSGEGNDLKVNTLDRIFNFERLPSFLSKYRTSDEMAAYILHMSRLMSIGYPTYSCEPKIVWLNALIGRLSWDFFTTERWVEKVKKILQKKIDKIDIPYFMLRPQVKSLDLGSEIPILRRASKPFIDEQGFWVEIDLYYPGGFNMSVETKVDLMTLCFSEDQADIIDAATSNSSTSGLSNCSDGDNEHGARSEKIADKINFYARKLSKMKYFKEFCKLKYVKSAAEKLSNQNIVINIDLRGFSGTLCLNIHPPPTDRLWYGFRENYQLSLVCQPKIGDKNVSGKIAEWIERKLHREFQKVYTLPNMDNVKIPLLVPDNGHFNESNG